MANKQGQLDLKNLTKNEFKNLNVPDGYVFFKVDFEVSDKPKNHSFRLHYGDLRQVDMNIALQGPKDYEVFDQAYFAIAQGLEQLNYASGIDIEPNSVKGKFSKRFELHDNLVKFDLANLVETTLANNFSNIAVPYVSIKGIDIDFSKSEGEVKKQLEQYSIPSKKLTYFKQI